METKNNRTWTLSADNVRIGACYWLKKNSIECKCKGVATIVPNDTLEDREVLLFEGIHDGIETIVSPEVLGEKFAPAYIDEGMNFVEENHGAVLRVWEVVAVEQGEATLKCEGEEDLLAFAGINIDGRITEFESMVKQGSNFYLLTPELDEQLTTESVRKNMPIKFKEFYDKLKEGKPDSQTWKSCDDLLDATYHTLLKKIDKKE